MGLWERNLPSVMLAHVSSCSCLQDVVRILFSETRSDLWVLPHPMWFSIHYKTVRLTSSLVTLGPDRLFKIFIE